MYSSKDELIELPDLATPTKSTNKSKKRNKIDLSPTNSVTTTSRRDIVNLFSIKKTSRIHNSRQTNSDSVSQTISDTSDEIFITERDDVDSKIDVGKTYRDKISKHLKNIKQKAATSHKLKTFKGTKSAFPLDRLRRENKDVDADIESVRSKFKRNRSFAEERVTFFFTEQNDKKVNSQIDENEAVISGDTKKLVSYCLPEQLSFNIELSEKECYFITDRKPVDTEINEELQNSQERFSHAKIKCRNLLEKRLLSANDKKWFNNEGNLEFLENPISEKSVRPFHLKYNGQEISCYLPAITKEECNEIIIIKENILELHLMCLKFNFHPLFSIEHYFAQKLHDLYKEFTYNNENNSLQKIKNDLENLRNSRNNRAKVKNDSKDSSDSTNKPSSLGKEIKKKRNAYFEQAKKERQTLKHILETWKIIKKIRDTQKYSNTDIKLLIKKEKVDFETENEENKKAFEEFLQEIKEEQKTELEKKHETELDDMDKSENDENSSDIPVSSINEDKIRNELKKKLDHSFRPPGEPMLKLKLNNDNKITEDTGNTKEDMRRNAVTSIKIYLKILCNGIEVCKSKPITLDHNFNLEIDETFSIQFTDIPEFLTIEVIEQPKGLLKKKICEININIPTRNISLKSSKLHKISFEKNDIVHYKHEGIGSGINIRSVIENSNLPISVKENRDVYTSGYLQYYIGWEKVSTEKVEECVDSHFNLLNEVTDKNLTTNTDKLEAWIEKISGWQESGNSMLSEYAEEYDHRLLKNNRNKYFRLSPHAESTKFCNITDIEQNVRLKILQLRNTHEIEFDGMVVPNRIKEISANLLADYKRRIAMEKEGIFEEDEDENELETQRNFGKKYLKQVHIKIFQKCKNSDNNLAYESVVNEKYLIYFEMMVKTLLRNFLNWFRWQPKINEPLPTKTEVLDEDKCKDNYKIKNQVNVIIKISGGRNIPNRITHTNEVCETEGNIKNNENEVKPFVEVSYGNLSIRTNASKGVNPVWNETLMLPLESQHTDYLNPNSLNGSITVNVYDEMDVQIRNISTKCFNLLAGIEILLSAICYSDCMEGCFKLKLPQVLLGYETETDKHKNKSPKTSNLQSYLLHTYLHMEIRVEPNIPKLTPNMEELPCGEIPYLQEHIIKWNQSYNANFSNRKFSALAIDINAKTTCITRYLKPLEPPQINLDEFDITPEQCLRYVSLIPFTECNQFYQNVWLSTEQLLRFMVGSIIDHAVTLTCYLLALKMEVWLLLGYGIPHGSTAYVLVREYVKETETPTYYIYDVVYNEKYNLTDTYCPLQRIYCLVNGENVWANTQRSDNINLTRFDLNRRSDWLPLFTSIITAPIHFINNRVSYNLKDNTEGIEIQIERKIRKKIAKLRQLDRTIWNNNLGIILKNELKAFEINCMYNKNHYETLTDLEEELSIYDVKGYVLNTSFTSISAIVKKVKMLGIHVQEEGKTEFALGVYIQGYPSQLLSVWIFIVNVVKKDIV